MALPACIGCILQHQALPLAVPVPLSPSLPCSTHSQSRPQELLLPGPARYIEAVSQHSLLSLASGATIQCVCNGASSLVPPSCSFTTYIRPTGSFPSLRSNLPMTSGDSKQLNKPNCPKGRGPQSSSVYSSSPKHSLCKMTFWGYTFINVILINFLQAKIKRKKSSK